MAQLARNHTCVLKPNTKMQFGSLASYILASFSLSSDCAAPACTLIRQQSHFDVAGGDKAAQTCPRVYEIPESPFLGPWPYGSCMAQRGGGTCTGGRKPRRSVHAGCEYHLRHVRPAGVEDVNNLRAAHQGLEPSRIQKKCTICIVDEKTRRLLVRAPAHHAPAGTNKPLSRRLRRYLRPIALRRRVQHSRIVVGRAACWS